MANTSMSVVVCAFDTQAKAQAARAAMTHIEGEIKPMPVEHTAIVTKNARGEVAFHEADDQRQRVASATGAIADAAAWLLFNVAGMLGPVAGTWTGEWAKAQVERLIRDTGFPDAALTDLGQMLELGQAALILLADDRNKAHIKEQLRALCGQPIDEQLPPNLVEHLRA